ncbi:MAG TPA: OmpA family protein [Polyangia bacterium]|nr:OmpA family protein [Polyangia bacterium]
MKIIKGFVAAIVISAAGLAGAGTARAIDLDGLTKKAVGSAQSAATGKVEQKVNAKLLADARKNQCSFKSDTDELAPGCDAKLKKLTNALVEAKKQLDAAGVRSYKFEVSGHTDTSGSAEHNKQLSEKRAQVIVKELVARGIAAGEIVAVGMGSEKPLVTPDNTPAKKAKNRRYEIRVRL